ncbi:MAG: AAA family ATPase, partial [Deltaproteobacteria bacterium]
MQQPLETAKASDAAEWAERTLDLIDRAIVGKRSVAELCLVCVLAQGHLLLEDAPGVGKTTLARALAAALGLRFSRVQCTSDLLPSDILGVNVFDLGRGESQGSFRFRPGPIFQEVVLVDELNRASPRTQSALLEAMAEGSVSLEGLSHPLPRPFLLLATQNPLEHAGTYPLPDSQLDRFLFRLSLGYPPPDAERALLVHGERRRSVPARAEPGAAPLVELQAAAERVRLAPEVADYVMRIVEATRTSPLLSSGVSTRGALLLSAAARARALLRGRDFALPDDVKALAVPSLAHRV